MFIFKIQNINKLFMYNHDKYYWFWQKRNIIIIYTNYLHQEDYFFSSCFICSSCS